MTISNFNQAINLISQFHSTEIVINKAEPNEVVTPILSSPTIHIKNCCAGVINSLTSNGFTLSMKNGLMNVNKY